MEIDRRQRGLQSGVVGSRLNQLYHSKMADEWIISKISLGKDSTEIEAIEIDQRGTDGKTELMHSTIVDFSTFDSGKLSDNSNCSHAIANLIPQDRNSKLSQVLHEVQQMKQFIQAIKSHYQPNRITPYPKHYPSVSKLFHYNSNLNNPTNKYHHSSYLRSTHENIQDSSAIDPNFNWMRNNTHLKFTIDASDRKSRASQSPTHSSGSP